MRYFAYGSNMNWEQMQQRCPSARFLGVGRLKDHRLAITRKSRRRLCGTADVITELGSEVWGIVYEIDEADILLLDHFEDGYRRESMNVLLDGLERPTWIYIAEKESCPPPPSAHYKRLMLEGARHWRLPSAYIAYLEQIEAVED
jgi:gamma-glutamylcyclotransferase